jgi:hypothetical protein
MLPGADDFILIETPFRQMRERETNREIAFAGEIVGRVLSEAQLAAAEILF